MPVGLGQPLQADPDALDQGASNPISPLASYGAQFSAGASDLSLRGLNWLSDRTATADSPQISAEDANQRYGIDGALRFNQPISENDAAFRHAEARGQQWQSILSQRSNASPLLDMGAHFAGSLFDPLGLSVMAATDGIGTLAKGALGVEAAADVGGQAARSGLIANAASHAGELFSTAAEGAVMNAPFVGLDAYLHHDVGDDMSMGQALQDLAVGSIFHTGIHYAGKLFSHRAGSETAASGEAAPETIPPEAASPSPPADGMPDAVAAMSESARLGGWLKAVDDMADDRPVDVGQYVEREAAPPSLSDLDETSAAPQIPGRWLDEDTAITPRGREFPVRYGLAEMDDLTTSHDNDFNQNPAYPAELQPRDRSLVGAMANNLNMERDLNPRLLMSDVNAAGGAPIIAPDGVVESGNGRTIALRRSAAEGRTDAYPRYRAALEAAGYDTTGMQRPMLVRQRTEPMTGSQRGALARDMNADVTERMSAPEQAQADARRISDDDLATVENPLTDRTFQRTFLGKVAPDQVNQLVDASGRLSGDGARRIKSAILTRAFGEADLSGRVNASASAGGVVDNAHADGLAAAAPQWAKMRAMAARGEIPRGLDVTANLNSALDLVRAARAEGQALGSFMAERFGQLDAFSGDAVAPETEAFLRILYRDEGFKKPREPGKVAFALNDYARQAMAVTPGPDLFGASADGSTARQILAGLNDRFARGDAGAIDLRAPGKALDRGAEPAPGVALIDLRAPDAERGGADAEGLRPGDGPEVAGEGDRSGHDIGPEQLAAAPGRLSFTTAKGSTYRVEADGKTTRDKAFRLEHGEKEQGPQPTSDRTFYVSADDAQKLAEFQAQGGPRVSISQTSDGRWGVRYEEGKDAGKFERRTVVQGQEAPAKGLTPVELWKNGSRVHFGNEITEVRGEVAAKPPAAERLIAADPELKALQDVTARMAAENRVAEDAPPASQEPDNIVKALHAAASCLIEAAGEVFG